MINKAQLGTRWIYYVFVVTLVVFFALFVSSDTQVGYPFSIAERTTYGIFGNDIYLTLTDTADKAQYITNLTMTFADSGKTRTIVITDFLLNQSYQQPIYGLVNISQGKYSTSEVVTWEEPTTILDANLTNVSTTIIHNKTVYKNAEGNMSCDYVLADKSCLQEIYNVTSYVTKYDYLPVPSTKDKLIQEGLKIEQKVAGSIPLAKGGSVQIKIPITHLPFYNMEVAPWENKYNITACSESGCSLLDPTWWNTSFPSRLKINCSGVSTAGTPVIINGSTGFQLSGNSVRQLVWTNCRLADDLYLYHDAANYVVGNETAGYPFEVDEGSAVSVNPTQVWTGYFLVNHMKGFNTTTLLDSSPQGNNLQQGMRYGAVSGGPTENTTGFGIGTMQKPVGVGTNVNTRYSYLESVSRIPLDTNPNRQITFQGYAQMIKDPGAQGDFITFENSTLTAFRWWYFFTGTSMYFFDPNVGDLPTTVAESTKAYSFYGVYNGSNISSYVNISSTMTLVGSSISIGGQLASTKLGSGQYVCVGATCNNGAYNWNGTYDEIRVFNGTITLTQQQDEYDNFVGLDGHGMLVGAQEELFQLLIQSPTNSTYTIALPYTMSLNYTVSGGTPDQCWYNLTYNGAANVSNTQLASCANGTFDIVGYGNFIVTVRANDTNNVIATADKSFYTRSPNTCTYSGTGDFRTNLSDSCNITTNVILGGGGGFETYGGPGIVTITGNITNASRITLTSVGGTCTPSTCMVVCSGTGGVCLR